MRIGSPEPGAARDGDSSDGSGRATTARDASDWRGRPDPGADAPSLRDTGRGRRDEERIPSLSAPTSRVRRSLFGLVAFLYVFTFPYHPGLRSPNELCRLYQARAIVDHGTLALDQTITEYGMIGDLSVSNGRYYPSKAPLLSFAAVPVYATLKLLHGGEGRAVSELELVYFSRLLLTVLPTLLALVLLRRWLRAFVSHEVADAVTVTWALGSLAFSYSLLFMSHQPTAVLLLIATYLAWRIGRGERGRSWLAGVGLLLGAAVMAEYTAVLGVFGVLVFIAAIEWQRATRTRERLSGVATSAGWVLAGAALPLGALMLYHNAVYGHPLESGYLHLNDEAYQPWHVGGFLGIGLPDPRAFALSLFSPLRGFFTLAPWLLLALPGCVLLHRRGRSDSPLFVAVVGVWVLYAYFTSAFAYESWGWTTGPRHLTPVVPFLLVPAALASERWRGVAAGLGATSILVTGLLTCVNYIPDSTSSPLFTLALPLFFGGHLPPTVLALIDAGTSAAGVLPIASILVAAGLVSGMLLPGPRAREVLVAATAAIALLVSLGLAARFDADDLGARRHLESRWLVVPLGSAQVR